jgi:galactokinase
MHEETFIEAQTEYKIRKQKEKMKKKQRKGKLAEKMHKITNKVNKQKETKKQEKERKEREQVNRRVKALLGPKIEEITKKMEQSAKSGDSSYHMSSLESDRIGMGVLRGVQEWARKEGFDIETSYSSIYEPPHCSDDLPSDYNQFLIISWE